MSIQPGLEPFLLESLANHVALPSRLPGQPETYIHQIEHALTVRLLHASRILRDVTHGELSHRWECTRHILQTCSDVNASGKLDKTSLMTELRRLEREHALILHVTEQNAGLFVQREQ
ncbi:hypothetical protein MMC27_000562, partial [Xylographa pallens]|nr:hypothetical protein [Xylographa pallens]